QPGYHSTGRSAAFWSETYGGPGVQPLTSASGPLLRAGGYLRPRGALYLARPQENHLIDQFVQAFADSDVVLIRQGREDLLRRVPGLSPVWESGLYEPSCTDIDVAALHQACLSAAKRQGA